MKKIIFAMIIAIPFALAFGRVSITVDGGITGLTSNSVIDIDHDSTSIWLGSGGGASVSSDSGASWTTFGTGSGLPGDEISAMAASNRAVWIANSHSEEVNSDNVPYGDGISYSADGGNSWNSFRPFAYLFPGYTSSPGMLSYDLAVYDSIVYSASFYGGLIRSTNFGESWGNLFPSQLSPSNTDSIDFYDKSYNSLNNRVFSVMADTMGFPDTLLIWAGSAAGINRFSFADNGSGFDTYPSQIVRAFRSDAAEQWSEYDWHRDSVYSGSNAVRISGQSTVLDNDDWLYSPIANFTNATACSLFFRHWYVDEDSVAEDSALVLISEDGGNIWADTLAVFTDTSYGDSTSADSQWIDISSFASGKSSISVAFLYLKRGYESVESDGEWIIDDVKFIADGSVILEEDFEGDWGPYGDAPPTGWLVLDEDYEDQLPGNFVVALDVQKVGNRKTIWAACRPAFSGDLRVGYSLDDGKTWSTANITDLSGDPAVEAWDFAFSDDTVYVATSEGLFMSESPYSDWGEPLSGFIDTSRQTFVHPESPFFAVDVFNSDVWAGGADGVVKGAPGNWDVFRSALEPNNHYAYPSPFSPTQSTRRGSTIHFKANQNTYATVGIYDINLELVKTIVSGYPRQGGVESDDIIWDGTTGDGKLAANGIYFYRVELDSGEDLWGKVVLIK